MADDNANNHCGHCGVPATNYCAGCKNIKCCGRECQKKDWFAHKHLCKTYSQFATSPSSGLRRVIILPQDSIIPHFAWVKTQSASTGEPPRQDNQICQLTNKPERENLKATDERPGYEIGDFKNIFGPDSIVNSFQNIVFGSLGFGTHLDHSINALQDSSQPLDGLKVNQCLEYLTHSYASKAMGCLSRGDYCLSAMTKVFDSKFMRDINCSDLTLGVRGIVKNPQVDTLLKIPIKGEKILADQASKCNTQ